MTTFTVYKQHSQSKDVRLSDMCHVFLFVQIYLDIHLKCAKCIHVAKRRVKKRGKEQRHANTGDPKDNPNPECKYPITQLLFIGLPLASLWDYPFTVLTNVIDSS